MNLNEGSEGDPGDEHRGRLNAAVAELPPPAQVPATVNNDEDIQVDLALPDGTVAVETLDIRTSKLRALIIGINAYPNLSKLKGAVADADEIASFLTSESELKVPPDQIINLRDETATRQKIIESFKLLQEDPSINRGDPILIYYAGHGGLRQATQMWKESGGTYQVQVIFPYDYDIRIDDSSDPIECIPDRTIAALLNELAAAKGDNITVIFDSCHSASGTRDASGPIKGVVDRRKRSEVVKRDIPWDIDRHIVNPELGIAPPPKKDEFRDTNLPLCVNQTSHVHIAACGSEEKAWEENGRGVFTVALLKSIRANGVDKITYRDLINSLSILSCQSPHGYGKNKDRILFDSGVSSRAPMIPVEFERESGRIILQAGAASGVTTQSVWEVYSSVSGKVLLGRFQAESPHVSTVALKPEEKGGDISLLAYMEHANSERSRTRAYARQVRAGVTDDLRVYFTPTAKERIFSIDRLERAASYSIGSGVHDVGYVIHPTEDSADIAVDLYSEQEVSFRLCDRQAEQYGVAKLEKRVRAERSAIEEVLFAAAKWKWHLQRKNTDSGETTDPVTMELITMGVKPGRARMIYPERERKSMSTSGIADFEVRRQDLYGVKLNSHVDKPLYIRMFYFDTTDFSISDMFGHMVGKDPVMDAGGTFTIGDNAKGGTPLQFSLQPHEKVDLGYMKVFWSTEPLALEGLGQKPSFHRTSRKWTRLRGATRNIDQRIEWGTALLTLVQRWPDTGE